MILHERRPARHLRGLAALAVGVALGLAAPPAAAQQEDAYRTVTAQDLFGGIMEGGLAAWVEDPMERMALSTAMATTYIFGAADGAKDRQWCPGEDADVEELTTTVLDYLDGLPEDRLSENAALIVAEALGKAHPC